MFYGTAGKGTSGHLAAELFNMMAGIKMTPVHYRGGGVVVRDVLSGQVQITFSAIPPVLSFIQNGTMVGFATTGQQRDHTLPHLPTVSESGLSGFESRLWLGLLAPAGTPRVVVDKLSAATQKVLASEETKRLFAVQGYLTKPGTSDEFKAQYQKEVEGYALLIAKIGTIDN